MNIVIEYDTSVSNAPAGFKTAVQAAVDYFDNLITNPITVKILFSYGELNGTSLGSDTLGESSYNGNIVPYSTMVGYLSAAAISEPAYLSLQALPASDPTNGGMFWISDAQAAAFGIGSERGYTNSVDGYVALSSTADFTFDPSNRSVSGEYDAVGVLEHEISEAIGRVSDLGTTKFEGYQLYSPLDLFRYSSPGEHILTPSAGYFSVDGHTMLLPFNDPADMGDAGDWGDSVSGDAFDESSPPGAAQIVSWTDMQVMNLLGFQINWGNPSDINGDGQSDILWRNDDGTFEVWQSQAGASYATGGLNFGVVSSSWTVQLTADFSGLGKADILWQDSAGDTQLWLSNTGLGYTGFTYVNLGNIATNWSIQGVGDFNGDGKADILWHDTAGDTELWLSNSGSGFTGFSAQTLGTVPTAWSIQGVGDFTGEGKADILWRDTAGDTELWLSNPGSGFTGFGYQGLGAVQATWSIEGVGDFTGQGKSDILWRNTAGELSLWTSNSGSGFTGFTYHDLGYVPTNWTIQEIGDFNGDGKADILWRDAAGDVELWLSHSGSGFDGFTYQGLGLIPNDWHIV